jgi:ankyrin repeat protein
MKPQLTIFHCSKRNVQEKLNLLLQPQPNKIRPKGDTKVLRRLLVECKQLQKTRRLGKQRHRCMLKQTTAPLEGNISNGDNRGGIFSSTNTGADLSSAADVLSATLEPSIYGDGLLDTEAFGNLKPSSSPREERDGSFLVPAPITDFELPATPFITPALYVPSPLLTWDNVDLGLQSQRPSYALGRNDPSYSICDSPGYKEDLESLYPDFGLDLDSENAFPDLHFGYNSNLFGSMSGITDDTNSILKLDNGLHCHSLKPPRKTVTPFALQGRNPAVNSTHVRDTFDTQSSLQSGAYSCYDPDSAIDFALQVDSSQMEPGLHINQAECSSVQHRLPDLNNTLSMLDNTNNSRPSSSSSKISTLLSRMSLSPRSSVFNGPKSSTFARSCTSLSNEIEYPTILPGVFPEYCWQHLNESKLHQCSDLDGSHTCYSKHYRTSTPTYRSLRVDIFQRIVQRTIRSKDVHEEDTFGNSVIHISATMLAPPSYLISLIKMGANVNRVNNAGQTFLHLIKPEALDQRDDFCSLLEILSVQGFNFRQHDHLGQSPLHILMRPWIRPDILRAIITTLDSLVVHSQLSTTRDCFGYTVVGQMNLQGANCSRTDLDQAIFSLACETERRIVDPKDLEIPGCARWQKETGNKDAHARNYENHPSIETVEDLLQYEQHVDYWRTIVTARNIPSVEDSNGRNGLHCLAEACLITPEKPLPRVLLDQLQTLKDAGHTGTDNERECVVKSLLDAGVDPNNYDNNGNTPLMAFVSNIRSSESDESFIRILNLLLEAGSELTRRNRRGETALHLAIKLGRRAAMGVLLASGANVHVRTNTGLGIIELGQKHCRENKEDENLFGQIMVCMSLAASFGAVSAPTILDEWASPKWRLNTQTRNEPKGLKLVRKFISKKSLGSRGEKSSGVKTCAQ